MFKTLRCVKNLKGTRLRFQLVLMQFGEVIYLKTDSMRKYGVYTVTTVEGVFFVESSEFATVQDLGRYLGFETVAKDPSQIDYETGLDLDVARDL